MCVCARAPHAFLRLPFSLSGEPGWKIGDSIEPRRTSVHHSSSFEDLEIAGDREPVSYGGTWRPASSFFQVVKRNLAGLLRRSGKSFIARLGSVSTTTWTVSPLPLCASRRIVVVKKGLLKGRRMYRDWRRCFNRRPSTPFPATCGIHHRIVKNGREIPGFYTGWKTRFLVFVF